MDVELEAKCGQCQDVLSKDVVERGICDQCWKFSSEEKADIIVERLEGEVLSWSPLLQRLLTTSPHMKIARIKDVREFTGLNLKHAKRVIDKVNDTVPLLEDKKVLAELRALQLKERERDYAAYDSDRLERDLTDLRSRLQQESAETHRLRLSNQNLEARLGASNRELAELDRLRGKVANALLAIEKVSEAIGLVAKNGVTRNLADALSTLIDETLTPEDNDSDDLPF